MKLTNILMAAGSAGIAIYCMCACSAPECWGMAFMFALFSIYALTLKAGSTWQKKRIVVRLKGLVWTREDFCRGWLITGDTGSGKTRSGITPLLYQVFKNEPRWGGICIDDKGVYWETLYEMAGHFNRRDDLILLQVKPEHAPADWKPGHAFNLTSDRGIPFSTYAKFVVDRSRREGLFLVRKVTIS